jgi:hypothetical protein
MKVTDDDSQLTLVGTPDEFAEFIGFPDYDTLRDLRSALRHLAAEVDVEVLTKRAPWTITGSWENFAELIGLPEATTKQEVVASMQALHKELFKR